MKVHHPTTSLLVFYSSAALWNIGTGMMMILIPLYSISLGFSVLKISSVVALPVLVMLSVRFLGGALCDRFGERLILQLCYGLSLLSAIVLLQAEGFVLLLLSQSIANFSRGIYWIACQSLVTQLPGSSVGKRLGHLSASNHGGNLLGTGLGGVLAAFVGYHGSFLLLVGLSVACVLLGLAVPHVERKPRGRTVWQITAGVVPFLRYPRVWLGIFASFAAALPPTLCQSLFPIYLSQLGHGEQWIGLTVSGRALGTVTVVLILGSVITAPRLMKFFAIGTAGMGVFLVGTGLMERLILLALCIAALGIASGVMDLWYQVQATELSEAKNRSMAMASVGLGWPLSLFIAPLLLGWIAEVKGFPFAFLASGIFFLLVSAASHLYYRRTGNSAIS